MSLNGYAILEVFHEVYLWSDKIAQGGGVFGDKSYPEQGLQLRLHLLPVGQDKTKDARKKRIHKARGSY
jgi:hypothetical protein